jgi:hypothetical protein
MHEESYQHKGFTVVIGMEEDSEFADPRDTDNLGTMVCWHPDYVLGDEQISGSRGAVKTAFETEKGRTDFESMEQIERYLRLVRRAVVIMPLYLLDHSGISMSVGSNTVGRGDTACGGSDSWGNARGWDTTMVGFIYTTAERIEELCGKPREKSHAFYCPADWKGTPEAWIADQLRSEVTYYDAWLRGSVYYWAVKDADGETLESCGGYLIASEEDEKYLRTEAESTAKGYAEERDKERRQLAGAGYRGPGKVVMLV